MDPVQEYEPFRFLDAAAKETTVALTRANTRHGFIGGYATSLIGGSRMTEGIDVIVDSDPNEARNKLLQADARFTMTPSSKLAFSGMDNKPIVVELLRGGEGRQLKLPDANSVSLRSITANDLPERVEETPIPTIAPSVLVLTKLKRWALFANSTRPASTSKAARDVKDIQVILIWLVNDGSLIDFEGYPEKPKHELLALVRELYQMHTTTRPLLAATLSAEDLALISN
ncbi:hypothetical protein N7516_006122 [Penicillium verrucosum]|uniref:uncharacterized protein n=1 Tax=Penicillium verrucosum TaxID=60171 RepID=UPI0025457216|nr:uncharacterized protein N7516_006122 [Penicillium verrucosum]KAJ5931633.1 hypothetical protein N7516_006122 [Penicillium verrucosum]